MSERNECAAFEEDLSAWIDGEVSRARGEELRAHVASCGACRVRVAALRAVDAELASESAEETARDGARLAAVRRHLDVQLRDEARERPIARRAPRRERPWLSPLLSGAVGAAAAATLMLLLQSPAPATDPIAELRREAPVAAREPAAPLAMPEATVAERRQRDEAFARSGASAPSEGDAIAFEIESASELELIERMATLSDTERAALERDVARWRELSEGERDTVRAKWRAAIAP